MKTVTKRQVFWLLVLISMVCVVTLFGFDHGTSQPRLSVNKMTSDIWVSAQLHLNGIPELKAQGIRTVIDLRPDGEASDQPPAVMVESAARANDLQFFYVPVPHGRIPEEAVTALAKALASSPSPILLYCASGSRAARTWSLVEASRPDGLDGNAIQAAVKAAGKSAIDLEGAILQRISQRNQTPGGSR